MNESQSIKWSKEFTSSLIQILQKYNKSCFYFYIQDSICYFILSNFSWQLTHLSSFQRKLSVFSNSLGISSDLVLKRERVLFADYSRFLHCFGERLRNFKWGIELSGTENIKYIV